MARTALVLSAGGMFGAYQAGAWKVLSDYFKPAMVVGASIGAINGWAIAGCCDPDHLIQSWPDIDAPSGYPPRLPPGVTGGFVDSPPLQTLVQQMHAPMPPQSA